MIANHDKALKTLSDYAACLVAAKIAISSDDPLLWKQLVYATEKTVTRFTRVYDDFNRRGDSQNRLPAAEFLKGTCELLFTTNDVRALPVLLQLTRLEGPLSQLPGIGSVAREIIQRLTETTDEQMIAALIKAAADDVEDDDTRTLLESHVIYRGPTAANILVSYLGQCSNSRIIGLLRSIGTAAFATLKMLMQSPETRNLPSVAGALIEIAPDPEPLVETLLHNPSSGVRHEAARLAQSATPPIEHALMDMLFNGPTSADRRAAANAVTRLNIEEAGPMLMDFIRSLPIDEQQRRIPDLADMRHHAVVGWLETIVKMWPPEECASAAAGLAARGHPAGRAFVERHLWSHDPELRLVAADAVFKAQNAVVGAFDRPLLVQAALEFLTRGILPHESMIPTIQPSDPRVVRLLIKRLKQPNFEVRRRAARDLGGIGDLVACKYLAAVDGEEMDAHCQDLHAHRAMRAIEKKHRVRITPTKAEIWAKEWEDQYGPI
jgi:HEAT repeat protein